MSKKIALVVAGLIVALSAVVAAAFIFNVGGSKTYENKSLGISFSYPQSWGEVRQENEFDDVNMQIVLSFEKMPDARFITQTRSYSYPAAFEEDAIYYYSSYSPKSPAQFCSERKNGCEARIDSQCYKLIENHCSNDPPHLFLVRKLSKQNSNEIATMQAYMRKYKTLEKKAVITIFDQHFFDLQGETFRPLTLQADLPPMERDTFCLSDRSGKKEEQYNCMNEKDVQEVSAAISHFPETGLGKEINEVIQSIKVFPPKDQDNWYMTMVRNQSGEEVSSTSSVSSEAGNSQTDNEVRKPKENSTVVVAPRGNDPSLKTAKAITVEGLAGTEVKTIQVTHICEFVVDLKTDSIVRPESSEGEWKWSYAINEKDMCQGQNGLTFVPSTCDPTNKKWCDLSSHFYFISDVAALHPKSLQLTSPIDNDPKVAEATELAFKGIAGPEVGKITVTTGGKCVSEGVRFKQSTVIERPVNVSGQWNWDYSMKSGPDGICRGFNFVDFRPDSCPTQFYSDACGLREDYDFFSHAGYIAPKGLVMFRLGTLSDTSDLQDAQAITLTGAAGSDITSIIVHRECSDVSVYVDDTIPKPTSVLPDGSWEWSYDLSVASKTICRGNNSIGFTDGSSGRVWDRGASGIGAGIEFQSNVGFLPADKQLEAERVLKYKTDKVKEIENDKSVMVALSNPILHNQDYCPSPDLGEEAKKGKPFPKVLVEPIRLDDRFSVQLIWNEREGVPVVEFIAGNGIGDFKTPPPLNGQSCEYSSKTGADVYYLRPDRIIVDLGSFFESSDEVMIWDGKQWKSLSSFVPVVNNPVMLGPVNKDMFVVRETGGCCDVFLPTVPGQWSDFVLDASTLDIIDVHLGGAWR